MKRSLIICDVLLTSQDMLSLIRCYYVFDKMCHISNIVYTLYSLSIDISTNIGTKLRRLHWSLLLTTAVLCRKVICCLFRWSSTLFQMISSVESHPHVGYRLPDSTLSKIINIWSLTSYAVGRQPGRRIKGIQSVSRLSAGISWFTQPQEDNWRSTCR